MCFGLRNCCILSLEAATWCSSLCSVDLFGSGCVSSRAHHVGCGCVHCRARHFGSCCVSKRPCALCSSQQAVSLRVVLVLFCFCVLPAAESLWVSACILGGLFLEAATLSAVDRFFDCFRLFLELWIWKLRCAMLGWHYFVCVVH